MTTSVLPPKAGLVKIRRGAFDRALAEAIHGDPDKHVSNGQLAKFLGLAPSTASRLRTGEQGPGFATIARFRQRFPDIPLNTVFDSALDLDAMFGDVQR